MAINTIGAALGTFGSYEPPENVVVVNRASQLPAAVGGVHVLDPNTAYILGANVALTDAIQLATGVSIFAETSSTTLSSTVAGPLFVGGDFGTVFLRNFRVSNPNGAFFDVEDVTVPGSSSLVIRDINVAATKYGISTNLLGLNINSSSALNIADGITLNGNSNTVFEANQLALVGNVGTFVGIDFNTSIFQSIGIRSSTISGPASSIGIKGAASSANLPAGALARISDVNFLGALTPLNTIARTDTRWEFHSCTGVEDSSNSADVYLTASRTTPITVIAQFEEIGGTGWASDIGSRFTSSTAGVITYIGERAAEFLISSAATVSKVGGGSDRVAMRTAINGTSLTKSQTVTQNNAPTSLSGHVVATLQPGDTVSLQVANLDTTSDVISDNASIDIVEGG